MTYQLSSIKDSLIAAAGIFGRFALIGSTAFGMATYANFNQHKSYWNGTIERVQTVDFNMLSHMLPTKLSQALIEGDREEIQRTLDSNYGLFGLVVTNCGTTQPDCDQAIQYISNSNLPWRDLLTDENLVASTYDVLSDPPPLHPTGNYTDSRDPLRNPTGLVNRGRIIGRVYYVRGVPPSFVAGYSRWIKAWPGSFLSDSGANRYYSLTTILFGFGGLLAWVSMERGFEKRQQQLAQAKRQQVQSEIAQAGLLEEAQGLRQQLQGKLTENAQLITLKNQYLVESDAAQKRHQNQEAVLRASLQKLEDEIAIQQQVYTKERQRQADLQKAVQQQQQASNSLKEEISRLKARDTNETSEQQQTAQKLANLEKEKQANQKLLDSYTAKLEQARQELSLQTKEKEEKAKSANTLSEKIKESERQQAEASREKQASQDAIYQMEQDRERDKQHIQALKEGLKNEQKQGNELRALVSDINQRSLNLLERKVMDTLNATAKAKTSAWSIHSQFDVSTGRDTASMFTDCIVIGNSFVAIIEAKNYAGRVYTRGDTRNSVWLCSQEREDAIEIASCWGRNPYQQVKTYADNARQLFSKNVPFLKRNACKEVSFYSVVVFPDNADLSALDTDLGIHSRITQLGNLVDVLHELARQTEQFSSRKGAKVFSCKEIKDYLYGRKPVNLRRKPAA